MAFKLFPQKSFTIYNKSNITILVTDSGIGGLSVVSDLYNFFKENKYYSDVKIVYADARVDKKGYNDIEDVNVKIDLFSKKLFQLDRKINPDIIFIACNTLSILLNKTVFYQRCAKPIIDILDSSISLMQKALNDGYGVFVLGTKTTIGSNYYKNTLIEYGYSKDKIINQLCPNLAKYIERSYVESYSLRCNIEWLTNRIIQKKPEHFDKYAISLNCTHYNYALNLFKKQFKKNKENVIFLCPNVDIKNIFVKYINIQRFLTNNVNIFIYKPNITKKIINKFSYFLKEKNLYFLE